MTTRKELQEWLNRFPEDTIIEFGIQEPSFGYESYLGVTFSSPDLKDDDIGDGWEFTDFTKNKFVKPNEDHFGKCYLRIGEGA